MKPVTDPALLAQLDDPQPVTDPELLKKLEAPDESTAKKFGRDLTEGIGQAGLGVAQAATALFTPLNGGVVTREMENFQKQLGETVDQSRARNKGTGGQLIGNIVGSLPFGAMGKRGAVVEGVGAAGSMLKRLAGGAVIGGEQGFIAPLGGGDSRGANTTVGAVAGTAGQGVGELASKAGAGTGKVVSAVKDIRKYAGKTADDFTTPDEMRTAYKEVSDAAKAVGGTIKQEAFTSFADDAKKLLDGVDVEDQPKAAKRVQELIGLGDGPVDLNAIDDLAKKINRNITDNTDALGKMNSDGALLSQLKGKLMAFVNGAGPESVHSNAPEAIEGFQTARKLWVQKNKVDDLQRIYRMSTDPSSGKVDAPLLRNQLGNLWRAETKTPHSSYSKEELGQIYEAYRSGKIGGNAAEFLYKLIPSHVKGFLPNLGVTDALVKSRAGKFATNVSDAAENARYGAKLKTMNLQSLANGK